MDQGRYGSWYIDFVIALTPEDIIRPGKTVQMIATMAMNMPEQGVVCKTTLVVVPAALLQQVRWPLVFLILFANWCVVEGRN